MSPAQPTGIAWPESGQLSPQLAGAHTDAPLSLYVHVPFCSVRCGYCDFNTYTRGFGPGAQPGSYAESILLEAQLARRVLRDAGWQHRVAQTLFIGGGTPSVLAPSELRRIIDGLHDAIGLAPAAEVTVEANPDSIDAAGLQALADAGVTRVSFGMQSAVPAVLQTLERTHAPEKVGAVVAAARDAGMEASLDLIYGTPGESLDDWRRSLDAAVALQPGHVSAYALVIEEGTRMGAQVARGELPMPDPDDEAAKYEVADAVLGDAGYRWYEISNFALPDEAEVQAQHDGAAAGDTAVAATALRRASRHNLAYWRDSDWWGFGPGAHSHLGNYRWWNLKHPRAYADKVAGGLSPAVAGEILDSATRQLERVMLAVRTADGVAASEVPNPQAIPGLIADELIDGKAALAGRILLTLRGRLLADTVTSHLMGF